MSSYQYACSACGSFPYLDVDDEAAWCDDCNRCGRCCLRDPILTCHYEPEEPPVEVAELGHFCPLTSIKIGDEWRAHVFETQLPPPEPPYFNPLTGERKLRGIVLSEPVYYSDDGTDFVFFELGSVIDTPDGRGTAIERVNVLLEGEVVSVWLHDLEKGDYVYTICGEQMRWVRTSNGAGRTPLRVQVGRTGERSFLRGDLRELLEWDDEEVPF